LESNEESSLYGGVCAGRWALSRPKKNQMKLVRCAALVVRSVNRLYSQKNSTLARSNDEPSQNCCHDSRLCCFVVSMLTQKRSMRSLPAREPALDEFPEENPLFEFSRSWTATFGRGIGSFRCDPSGLEMMSPILSPEDWLGTYGCSLLVEGSMGASAGTCCRDRWRRCGSCTSLKPWGRSRGE